MNILESFKSFNEQHNNQPFITADDIVAHLDKTCPDWKSEIQNPGCWKEVFGSLEFAISMCNDEDTREYALDYLVQVLGKNWEQYPDDIKKEIFEEHEYWLRKLCTQQIWESLSESEKFILAYHIVVNEYNYVHDMANLYEHLSKGEEFTQPFFTSDVMNEVLDIQALQTRLQNEQKIRLHISTKLTGRFYQPTVDYEKMTYTPSEQLTRFQHFAQASGDTDIAKELDMAKWEIDRSFFDLKRLIIRKD